MLPAAVCNYMKRCQPVPAVIILTFGVFSMFFNSFDNKLCCSSCTLSFEISLRMHVQKYKSKSLLSRCAEWDSLFLNMLNTLRMMKAFQPQKSTIVLSHRLTDCAVLFNVVVINAIFVLSLGKRIMQYSCVLPGPIGHSSAKNYTTWFRNLSTITR